MVLNGILELSCHPLVTCVILDTGCKASLCVTFDSQAQQLGCIQLGFQPQSISSHRLVQGSGLRLLFPCRAADAQGWPFELVGHRHQLLLLDN